MDDPELLEVEAIKNDEKVQRALSESQSDSQQSTATVDATTFPGISAIIFLVCGFLYFLLGWQYFPIKNAYIPLMQKLILAGMLISFILSFNRVAKKLLKRKIESRPTLYNLNRISNLITALIIFLICLTLLFANWYAALISFGIISLILGFALQNPITSFFAWIYILIRKPYSIGDRIKIGTVNGDVIGLSYFDTTLWEFKGDYLSGDHPSGRVIKFSNARVFQEYVFNYSWPLFPFIWNELSFFVTYQSDLGFVNETVQKIVEEEIGEAMIRRVNRYKKILAETPVDQLEVNEYPSVIIKAHENNFLEVIVRYLVEPKTSGQIKKKLFLKLMNELAKFPQRVIFPVQ